MHVLKRYGIQVYHKNMSDNFYFYRVMPLGRSKIAIICTFLSFSLQMFSKNGGKSVSQTYLVKSKVNILSLNSKFNYCTNLSRSI